MRRTRVMALLAAGGLAVAGCSAPGPAEVTFFADGNTVNVTPLAACDPKTGKCSSDPDAAGKLKVRPGKPVQISVPGEIADSLWKVTAQYVNAKGEPQPLQETLVTSRDRYAYTVTPPSASDQILVVEIAQAAAISRTGNPEDAEPITIAIWSLQIEPAAGNPYPNPAS